jgi:hypothetical protein
MQRMSLRATRSKHSTTCDPDIEQSFELEALAGKLIDHCQHPKGSSSLQTIGHEVHRPFLIALVAA